MDTETVTIDGDCQVVNHGSVVTFTTTDDRRIAVEKRYAFTILHAIGEEGDEVEAVVEPWQFV